jgi:hypothetical protein
MLRRDGDEVAVDPQEMRESPERCREMAEPWWGWRLDRVVVQHPGLGAEEPAQVQSPQVAARDLGTKW